MADDVIGAVQAALGARAVEVTAPAPRRAFVTVAAADLAAAAAALRDRLDLRHLSTITGRDTGTELEALYHLAKPGLVLTLRVRVPRDAAELPTLTGLYPAAVLYEREVTDLVGIAFVGHPDPRPLVLPDGWPADQHPLRKDWQPPAGFVPGGEVQ